MTSTDPYVVETRGGDDGWEVLITDERRTVVSRRACASEEEARTYASTVRQHLRWLSPERFRAYYRIREPR